MALIGEAVRHNSHQDKRGAMRLLWVGKNTSEGGGEAVFDRKIIEALRSENVVDCLQLESVGAIKKIANVVSGFPHQRINYINAENVKAIKSAARRASYDAIICSWESLDILAWKANIFPIMILHNVTSDMLRRVFPKNVAGRLAAMQVALWERFLYRSTRFRAFAVLSERDREVVLQRAPQAKVVVLNPGAPGHRAFDLSGPLLPEIVISGTYDWYPKRRDLARFMAEFIESKSTLRLIKRDDFRLTPSSVGTSPTGVRFGVVTDRFEAGFKLKILEYVADGCIVISYSEFPAELQRISDASLFLRRVGSMKEIMAVYSEFVKMENSDLLRRFNRFRQLCLDAFTWQRSSSILSQAIAEEKY